MAELLIFFGHAGDALGSSNRNVYHFDNKVEMRQQHNFLIIFQVGFAVDFAILIELINLVNVCSKSLCCGSKIIQFGSGLDGS